MVRTPIAHRSSPTRHRVRGRRSLCRARRGWRGGVVVAALLSSFAAAPALGGGGPARGEGPARAEPRVGLGKRIERTARRLLYRVGKHIPPRLVQAARRRPADLIVLSDLHVGEGKNGETHSHRDLFRSDKEFSGFVDYLIERQRRGRRKLKVVLAGDTLDFLGITLPPEGANWKQDDLVLRDAKPDEKTAMLKLRRMSEAHPEFFSSLSRLLDHGHEVVFVAGNHDQELQFAAVQKGIERLVSDGARSRWRGDLTFEPWFHMHGDVLIEHGHRYDPINNISFPLHPFDADGRLRAPAGSLFVSTTVNRLYDTVGVHWPHRAREIGRALRYLPAELAKTLRFFVRIGERIGPLDEEVRARAADKHAMALRELAGNKELLKQINRTRQERGQSKLGREELLGVLRSFDRQMAQPHLRRQAAKATSSFRRALKMLSRKEFRKWLDPDNGGTLPHGQQFALRELANVVVTGHTHNAYLAMGDNSGDPTKHVVNAGTWAAPTSSLTYVDIRLDEDRSKVHLRRWDRGRNRVLSAEEGPAPTASR